MRKQRKLLFISLNYPFHYADSFIEPEFYKIAPLFDEVTIFSLTKENLDARPIPTNTVALKLPDRSNPFSFIGLIRCIGSRLFLSEFIDSLIRYRYAPSLGIIKQSIKYFLKAHSYRNDIRDWLIANKNCECMIYSYFMIEPTLAAAMLKNQHSFSLITRLHGYDLYFERGEYGYLPYRRFLLDKLNALFFISENGLTYFKKKLAVTKKDNAKLHLARLGINLEGKPVFQYKTPQPLTIVSTSWILANKRLGLIAEALKELSGKVLVRWVHFGGHRLIDKAYYQEFINLVENIALSCPEQKIELMGNTPKDQIFEFFRNQYVHLFINVSESEGIPISMMEALSFGIPVVGTHVGGVSELVKDGSNGFLLTPNTHAHEIASILNRFATLPENEITTMRQNAFKQFEDHFLADNNYSSFSAELNKIMA